jgi:hypothetical protein
MSVQQWLNSIPPNKKDNSTQTEQLRAETEADRLIRTFNEGLPYNMQPYYSVACEVCIPLLSEDDFPSSYAAFKLFGDEMRKVGWENVALFCGRDDIVIVATAQSTDTEPGAVEQILVEEAGEYRGPKHIYKEKHNA